MPGNVSQQSLFRVVERVGSRAALRLRPWTAAPLYGGGAVAMACTRHGNFVCRDHVFAMFPAPTNKSNFPCEAATRYVRRNLEVMKMIKPEKIRPSPSSFIEAQGSSQVRRWRPNTTLALSQDYLSELEAIVQAANDLDDDDH
jgi:hypothetical protein